MTHNADDEALMREIGERVEFLNFAYTHLDTDEYMAVVREHRPFRSVPPNDSLEVPDG